MGNTHDLVSRLSEADRNRLIFWRIGRAGRPAATELAWVQSLLDAIAALAETHSPPAATVFWLRLYGTVTEIREGYDTTEFDKRAETEDANAASDPFEDEMNARDSYYRDFAAAVHEQCTVLINEFTEDEVLYLQWRRDSEAHVTLDTYDLAAKKGPQGTAVLYDERTHRLLGRRIKHDDFEARMRALLTPVLA